MLNDHHMGRISSIIPLTLNKDIPQLNYIRTINENSSIYSSRSCSNEKSNFLINCFKNLLKKFDFINIEERGIDRILSEERTDLTIINTAMIWIGANTIIPCFAVGTLGPSVFKLDLYSTFLTILIFNLIGIIPIAIIACFGPASGLRTMVFSRYSLGYYGASIMSIINIINALCWASINSITGAQSLRVVFNDSLSISVGIVIIGIISMIVSFVGYKWIHIYERYSWIPVFIVFCIIAIIVGKSSLHSQMISGNVRRSNSVVSSRLLNFGASCFGCAISWCSFAGDYNTYFPENTNQLKIFLLTYVGNILSIIPLELLGATAYTMTYTNQNWLHAYQMDNVGGLLGSILSSLGGFGKFLLIILSLSTIAGNIPNIYSLALSAQVISSIFKRIPRILYIIIGTILYILLAIISANKFNDNLISFVDVISYVFSIFIVIIFEDHLLFRRSSFKNYDFNIWNNKKLLPISIAALLSTLVGIIGIILGMSQTWFTGPISKAIGSDYDQHYANLGFETGFIFTGITFPLFRLIELHFIKR